MAQDQDPFSGIDTSGLNLGSPSADQQPNADPFAGIDTTGLSLSGPPSARTQPHRRSAAPTTPQEATTEPVEVGPQNFINVPKGASA